jgi:hypothetical protein
MGAAVQGKRLCLSTHGYRQLMLIQFVGPPFAFSLRQVGTNCGFIGQHCSYYANGVILDGLMQVDFLYMMEQSNLLPCLVEDFVFTTQGRSTWY